MIGRKPWAFMAALLVSLGVLLSGCSSGPSPEELTARLEPVLTQVPGVTGGTVRVTHASLSLYYSCKLTSDAATAEELSTVLTDVLTTLVENTRDESGGSSVSCFVKNGSDIVTTADLDLGNPTSLDKLRARFG